MESTDQRVDLNALIILLEQCLRKRSVDLEAYLEAFRGLYRFFCQLGTVFGFVASDVLAKIEILDRHRNSVRGAHYETVESMVAYEKNNDLLKTKEPSGSRTLLRLHRAMNFIVTLLQGLGTLRDGDSTSPVARKAYEDTISRFHTWIIRKAALLAMYVLPTMDGLVRQTCVQSTDEFRRLIPEIVDLGRQVYDSTEKVYIDNDCLKLP